ncbi:MAG: hypothetical protein IKN04_18305 [Clostridia bacterium]|nr:hypothetical protein [Clostridia bacterium]
MDLLSYIKARQAGSEADEAMEAVSQNATALNEEAMDKSLAVKLVLSALKTLKWEAEDGALICEEGTATLTNNLKFPFNGSKKSVALTKTQRNTSYAVIASVQSSTGDAGDVIVSEKLTNAFKLEYTGAAKSATVKYIVIGGII